MSAKKKEVLPSERNHYVLDNLNLVHYIVKNKFGVNPSHSTYEDYYQTGCMGLIQAAIRFDESRGFQFSTYASAMICGTIQKWKRDGLAKLKIPRTAHDTLHKIIELQSQDMDNSEIVDLLGITYYELNQLCSIHNVDSLDSEVTVKGDSVGELHDIIPSNQDEYENLLEEENIVRCIDKVSQKLTNQRARDIWVEYIYSIYYGEKLKHEYFTTKYDISQPQVSRILNNCKNLFAKYLQQDS